MISFPGSAGDLLGGFESGSLVAVWHACVTIVHAAPALIGITKRLS